MSQAPAGRSWMPGAALLAAAAVAAGLAGLALGIRTWPPYLGLAALVIIAMGWIERVWMSRQQPAPPRSRGRLKVIRGGGKAEYDLASDETTNNQRYLM